MKSVAEYEQSVNLPYPAAVEQRIRRS